MAEYIERSKVLAEYDRQHEGAPGRARKIIEAFPAADVAEVRHGRWMLKDKSALDRKPKSGEEIFCDQCGEVALGYPFWECDLKPSNFCPNCGAKMDYREGDEDD